MGAGKSKVGTILAVRLDKDFVDTDGLVEESMGKSIADIFRENGEESFRRFEHEAIRAASERDPSVIALGGGAVTRDENWEIIKSSGTSVYLHASPETIFHRVSRKRDRPLLAGLDDDARLEKIRSMLSARDPFYRQADIYVESVDDRTPDQTADLVIRELDKRPHGS